MESFCYVLLTRQILLLLTSYLKLITYLIANMKIIKNILEIYTDNITDYIKIAREYLVIFLCRIGNC